MWQGLMEMFLRLLETMLLCVSNIFTLNQRLRGVWHTVVTFVCFSSAPGVLLHACTLKSGCYIGMGAQILNNAVVEPTAMVGTGAVVKEGTIVKGGQVSFTFLCLFCFSLSLLLFFFSHIR